MGKSAHVSIPKISALDMTLVLRNIYFRDLSINSFIRIALGEVICYENDFSLLATQIKQRREGTLAWNELTTLFLIDLYFQKISIDSLS